MIPQTVSIEIENIDAPNFDKILRTVASTMLGEILDRIHNKYQKADGSNIGSYKDYENSYYIKNKTKAGRNPQGNKVNLSNTAQSLQKLTVVAEGGKYGLGWINPTTFQIAEGNEERYGIVYAHTEEELRMIEEIAANEMRDALLGENNTNN